MIESSADDGYVQSKTPQENLVVGAGLPTFVLRLNPLFRWFGLKHLGWLARLHEGICVDLPGAGQRTVLRQLLYARDFAISSWPAPSNGRRIDLSGEDQLHRPNPP
jgi:hypothetical protein